MTGATMRASHAGKVAEGRDPSPSLKPASTGSSDEVEPWDEPPSKTTTRDMQEPSMIDDMMKSAVEFLGGGQDDERLDDGDLPTLSLKKERVKGQYVSGERSTRPLSPPSTNGLEVDVKDNDPPMRRKRAPTPRTAKQAAAQRQFWSQLNPPSPFETDSSRDQDDHIRDPEEGPDDEMAARRAYRAHELDNVPKQEDETVDGDQEHYRGKVSKAHSYEEGSGTCIEYTLASIGDICGTRSSSVPIKNSDRPTQIREARELREGMVADDAEEHTAIEVEYVDPGPIPRRSPPATPRKIAAPSAAVAPTPTKKKDKKKQEKKSNKELPTSRALDGESVELKESETSAWSSSRKNAVLAAMARKAKEDFERHENEVAKQGPTPVLPRRIESPAGDQDNMSDIYNSFSPSEKRKFLKLINLGLTPTESTTRVVEERQNNKESVKSSGSLSKKRFSFWKKSAKVDASRSPPLSPRSPAVVRDAPSVSSTAAVGEAEEGDIHQGEAEAAIVPSDSLLRDEGSDAIVSKGTYSPPAKDSDIPAMATSSGEETPEEQQEEDDIRSGSMMSTESVDSAESEPTNERSMVAAAAGASAVAAHQASVAARQDAADTTPPSSYEVDDDESSEEEDSVRGQFPRSGVNYYDGIRRELPEEDDSDDDFGEEMHSPSSKPSKASRLASLTGTMSPHAQGFSSLKESMRNIIVDDDQPSKQPKSISKSLSPLGRQPKPVSNDRPSPLSPGASASARRRYLGIPMLSTGKGFAPLEEDVEAAEVNAIQDEKVSDRGIQLPEEVTSAVAEGTVATAVTVQKSQSSDVPSEDRPLPSMEDPFYGLDSEDAETTKQSKDEDAEKVVTQEPPKEQMPEMDISLDSYLESATIQSYAGSHHDQLSVVNGSVISGRSGFTAGTGMTGHTQSSRKRRPGAAKERIAKSKEAEKTVPKGWHESIRAAAATNNREWDPQKGWVDYKDPSEDVHNISIEKLHISLAGVATRSPSATDKDQSGQDNVSRSQSVAVPFPPGWEKERNDMLSTGQTAEAPPRDMTLADSYKSQKTPVQSSEKVSPKRRPVVAYDSPKPRGWEASMREASAEVSKDGQRWDPERGWVGLDKNVLESSALSQRNAPETDQHDDSADDEDLDAEDQKTSPSTIFAALTKAPSEGKIRDAREFVESESRSTASRSRDVKMDNLIVKSSIPTTTVNQFDQSAEDSDQAVVPGIGEKYVQLGENGSVKAVSRKKKVALEREDKPFHPSSLRKGSASKAARPDTTYDDDKAPLLMEDSGDSAEERGRTVQVVKQRVDEDDFSLFTANDGAESSGASPSRRRGTGPVDVDEVDNLDTETESDGDEDGEWEPDSYLKGKVSPGMFVRPKSERTTELSGFAAAVSPTTKTPLKLQKSRRDTSPIRSVGGGTASSETREVISPDAMSSPNASPARDEERSHAIEQSASLGDESAGSSNVKQLAQKWEIRAKHGSQIVQDQSGDSFEYDERQVTVLGDFGPNNSDEAEWPDYYEKPSQISNQEWKSFLGKKVKAESAAAATMEETRRRDGSLGASKPGIPRAPGPTKRIPTTERGVIDEQGDSSFSSGDGPSDGDGSPSINATSAFARRRERALQQNSPGGFSDVSPIPAGEDSFGVDDVRMERVSDTGTAVEQNSFMKRLSACAAPLSRAFTQNLTGADGMPSSHLDFMRTNPAGQASPNTSVRFVPAGICGRQDIINEDEESDDDDSKRSLEHQVAEQVSPPVSPTSKILKEVKQRSSSRGKTRKAPINVGNEVRSPPSSVVSDDFGARTSYLEAIALRSAVSSGSKKKKSRRSQDQDNQSAGSDATSESKLSHSERWQAFLERKASQTASPPGSRTQSSTEISRAAERYASEKVEEMMEVMASRSKSTPKSWRSAEVEETLDTSYGDSSTASPLSPYRMTADGDRSMFSKKSKKKSESVKAAEELAAARVEAMMAAMTSSNLDEGEI